MEIVPHIFALAHVMNIFSPIDVLKTISVPILTLKGWYCALSIAGVVVVSLLPCSRYGTASIYSL